MDGNKCQLSDNSNHFATDSALTSLSFSTSLLSERTAKTSKANETNQTSEANNTNETSLIAKTNKLSSASAAIKTSNKDNESAQSYASVIINPDPYTNQTNSHSNTNSSSFVSSYVGSPISFSSSLKQTISNDSGSSTDSERHSNDGDDDNDDDDNSSSSPSFQEMCHKTIVSTPMNMGLYKSSDVRSGMTCMTGMTGKNGLDNKPFRSNGGGCCGVGGAAHYRPARNMHNLKDDSINNINNNHRSNIKPRINRARSHITNVTTTTATTATLTASTSYELNGLNINTGLVPSDRSNDGTICVFRMEIVVPASLGYLCEWGEFTWYKPRARYFVFDFFENRCGIYVYRKVLFLFVSFFFLFFFLCVLCVAARDHYNPCLMWWGVEVSFLFCCLVLFGVCCDCY